MIQDACASNYVAAIVAFLWCLHAVLEYWLGKTDKTKAGSTLELAVIAAVWIFGVFALLIRRKKNE